MTHPYHLLFLSVCLAKVTQVPSFLFLIAPLTKYTKYTKYMSLLIQIVLLSLEQVQESGPAYFTQEHLFSLRAFSYSVLFGSALSPHCFVWFLLRILLVLTSQSLLIFFTPELSVSVLHIYLRYLCYVVWL